MTEQEELELREQAERGRRAQIALDFMNESSNPIIAAFVSTNSICQGESVPAFWKQLVVDHKAEIQFAYSTFIWDSEASIKAHEKEWRIYLSGGWPF